MLSKAGFIGVGIYRTKAQVGFYWALTNYTHQDTEFTWFRNEKKEY